MSTASAKTIISGVALTAAQALWYDRESWPLFIDGLRTIVSVSGEPPLVGSSVVWQSTPAGRGEVRETVLNYEPGVGQELEVEDRAIAARQRVHFLVVDGQLRVQLELDYRLKSSNPFRAVTDWLFIRRAQSESLQRTLTAFRLELEAQREAAAAR
ncbi:MAG: hypothetical protein JHC46_06370 [Solirubrobacteraceae bacterium]|nr:hypothetical protein [Solirubrobacteraceae bacterium]